MIEFGHASHAGLEHGCNEDTYWAGAGSGLFLVADGMGGHGRGDVAAALARDAIVDAARAGQALDGALRAAGELIASHAAATPEQSPMGAAVAVLQLAGDAFQGHCIGDSHILCWHQGTLAPVDTAPPADGDGSPSDSARRRRHRVTQALGITPAAELDIAPVVGAATRGMQFLLCSDGLMAALGSTAIAALLARTDLAAQECVDHLLLAALTASGRNDATAILLRIG